MLENSAPDCSARSSMNAIVETVVRWRSNDRVDRNKHTREQTKYTQTLSKASESDDRLAATLMTAKLLSHQTHNQPKIAGSILGLPHPRSVHPPHLFALACKTNHTDFSI